jgi:hypothetical protein
LRRGGRSGYPSAMETPWQCRVPLLDSDPPPGCDWDGAPWRGVLALSLEEFMGARPAPFPFVQARLAAGPTALGVIFRVEDWHVRSVVRDYQGPVWTDSCVELFLTPGTSLAEGYFNIEVNCGGAFLFRHQQARDRDTVAVCPEHAGRLGVAHSMPPVVDPELPGPVTWTVGYSVPYEVLESYAPVARPAPGVRWRANLYKCGDATSHPHWITWSRVSLPEPDFHRKEFFGTLLFGR